MRRVLFLGLALAVCGCEDTRPPAVGSGPPGGMTGSDAGMDAGDDGGGAAGGMAGAGGAGGAAGMAGDGGTFEEVSCVELPATGNLLTVNTTASISFEADVAFATWSPNACSPVRSLSIGFDTEGCGFETGELLTFLINEADIGINVVVGTPILPTVISPVRVRLRADDGTSVREWGNCVGSSGSMTFLSLAAQPGGDIRLNFNVTLADCSAPGLPSVTVIGSLSVTGADECPPQ